MTRFAQFTTWWEGLAPERRRYLLVAGALAVAAVVAVGLWSGRSPMTPILEDRGWDELLDAAAALDQAGVAYTLADGRLSVAPADLGKARAAVATTTAVPGLADVGELQLGLTPQAQAWAFLRAREGDLARMINGIDGVSASRVNIVPKAEALFIGEEEPASASVFVKLKPGASMGAAQVRAITNLVANGVEGLSADAVTVVDDKGNLLAEGVRTSVAGEVHEELLAYRASVEERTNHAVTRALLPVLGWDGGFSVTSTVDVDSSSSETVSKRLDSEAQALVSEQLEESSSTRQPPGGIPGVDANLPERPAEAAAGGGSQEDRSSSTANYTYPTVDEVVRRPAGDIRRVSVAVQVDAERLASLAEAGKTTPEELQQRIEKAVQAAVGFDAQRGDLVAVHVMPFAPRVWEEGTAPASAIPAEVITALPYAVAALAVVLLFTMVVRPLVRAATAPPPVVAPADGEAPADDANSNLVDLDAKRPLAARLAEVMESPEPLDAHQLSALVAEQPAAAAKVLRLWSRPT